MSRAPNTSGPLSGPTGTVPSGRLTGAYSQPLNFNNLGNQFAGNGSALTALNASQLDSGTLPSGRLTGTYSLPLTLNHSGNQFSGNGAGLTGLDASQFT